MYRPTSRSLFLGLSLLLFLFSFQVSAEMLVVTSNPPASIFINGIARGKTPVRLRATPGSYRIELRQRGYQKWSSIVVVPAKANARFDVTLTTAAGGTAAAAIQPLQPTSPPQPAKTATPKGPTGLLYLLSSPANATVEHNGKIIGRTPLLTQLPLGLQSIVISKPGMESLRKFVNVQKRMQRIRVLLKKAKKGSSGTITSQTPSTTGQLSGSLPLNKGTGQLLIFSKPSATVVFDGKVLGQTPLVSAGFATGRYMLQLKKKGYRTYRRWLTVTAGQAIRINALLIPNRK